jgi:hypothetical protein
MLLHLLDLLLLPELTLPCGVLGEGVLELLVLGVLLELLIIWEDSHFRLIVSEEHQSVPAQVVSHVEGLGDVLKL